jgi:hypothetical protein
VVDFHRDGSHSVTRYGVPQYTQRTFERQGRSYLQRSYTRGHVTVIKNYNSYYFGGYTYHSYIPVLTYEPWFYGYVYRRWYDPFPYRWSWVGAPWYARYGYYYRPYVTYYAPTYWLTDFVLADLLELEYQNNLARAQADAAYARRMAQDAEAAARLAQSQPPVISDEIKEQIKAQVEEAIRAHERKQPLTLDQVTRDTRHIFAVTDDLNAMIEDTQNACSLSTGDLIRLAEVPDTTAPAASVIVVTSKRGSCPAGARLSVAMSDLQEYLNDFSERLERGMQKMKTEVANKQR